MKSLLSIFLVVSSCASGAITIHSIQATATQVLIQFTAPTSPSCTLQLSELANQSVLVADTDTALYTNANTEATHLATSWVRGANTVRTVRIGLRSSELALDGLWHSRALAADTQHYGTIICAPDFGYFEVRTNSPGGIVPEPLPTSSTAWGQLAYPEFVNYTSPVIDPQTGLKIYSADPSGWSSSQSIAIPSGWYSGGGTWSGSGFLITDYVANVTTTSDTSTIAVRLDMSAYADGLSDFGGYWPYDNFLDAGIDLYGSGSDASSVNRTVRGCLSIDSGQSCYTGYVSAVLPQTTNAVSGTLPTTYPTTYFGSWGKRLPRNVWQKQGYVTASSGVLTLTKDKNGAAIGSGPNSVSAYFNQDWVAGTRLYVAGSSGSCSASFCTIASVTDATHLTIVESTLTIGENAYRSADLAVILNKTTATGTLSLSVRGHYAKGYPHDLWSGGCSNVTVTSGDGITGYPCIFPRVRQDAGGLYFLGISSPVVRLISLFKNAPATCTNADTNDCPSGLGLGLMGPSTPQFDLIDPTVVYTTALTNGGKIGIFKVQYLGTWAVYNNPFVSTTVDPPNTSEMSWTNVTPQATGNDVRAKILANTTYNESLWPSLTANVFVAGLAGPYMILYSPAVSQDSPCWIYAFTASTGAFYRAWRTDDGSSIAGLHWAGCHSTIPVPGSTAGNAGIVLTTHLLNTGTSSLLGGPFAGSITHVKKSGSYNTNTSLPWPIDSTYDNTCPVLPQWMIDRGATGNQCVFVKGTQPCNVNAGAAERAAQPCPWDSARSYSGTLAVGDFIKSIDGDNEGLMVVEFTDTGSGTFTATLERNANFSYCSFGTSASTPQRDGVQSAGQLQHSNGWTYFGVVRDSCAASTALIDITGNAMYTYNANITRGHFDATISGTGLSTMIGAGALDALSRYIYPIQIDRSFATIFSYNDFTIPEGPAFAGYQSDQGTQSYVERKQFTADATKKQYAFDFRHYDPSLGLDLEWPGQTLGNNTNLTLQGGTSYVYKLSFTGTADTKHQALRVWAGEKYLIEKTSASTGNTLTDSDLWKFCYALNAGECRSGSSAGDLYAVLPRLDVKTSCWQSQVNLRVPCAFAGPTQGFQATQIKVSAPDPAAVSQRWLGPLLMGPEQQYVYSKVIPTPDASYMVFGGFQTSGYHTAIMMAKLPPFPADSISRATYTPVILSGTGTSVIVQFGYQEYGATNAFFCTPRQEICKVAGSTINEATPFKYAAESLTGVSGAYTIVIPALPGRLLYYRVVDNGVPGDLQVMAVR